MKKAIYLSGFKFQAMGSFNGDSRMGQQATMVGDTKV